MLGCFLGFVGRPWSRGETAHSVKGCKMPFWNFVRVNWAGRKDITCHQVNIFSKFCLERKVEQRGTMLSCSSGDCRLNNEQKKKKQTARKPLKLDCNWTLGKFDVSLYKWPKFSRQQSSLCKRGEEEEKKEMNIDNCLECFCLKFKRPTHSNHSRK